MVNTFSAARAEDTLLIDTTAATATTATAITLQGSSSALAHREGAAAACQRALDAVLLDKSLAAGRVTFALCIKPNHQLSFGVFDHRCVVEQIRCVL
jgi:hypothetical protein